MLIKIFAILLVVGFTYAGASGQQSTPTPQPTPAPTPDPRQAEIERQQREQQRRMEDANRQLLAGGAQRDADMGKRASMIDIGNLYRGSTEAERSLLAPSPTLHARYAELLKQPHTGL